MFERIAATPLAQYIITHAGAQQLLETIHMASFSIVVGAMVLLHLRLAGVSPRIPLRVVAPRLLFVAWIGMGVLLAGGVIVSLPRIEAIISRTSFQIKAVLLVLAVANLVLLGRALRRHGAAWDAGHVSTPVRMLAALSILLWISIIVVARFMYAVG